MANANAPYGLKAVKYDEKLCIHAYIPSTDATAHYLNQPVQLSADGANATASSVGTQPGALPIVETAGSTGVFLGTILSFVGLSTSTENIVYNPASTAREVIVCADPNAIYQAQVSGALTATDIGLNTNFINLTSGSTVTGNSSTALDSSLFGTTSTLQVRVLSVVDQIDNELGSYASVLCRINNTNYTPNTAGI